MHWRKKCEYQSFITSHMHCQHNCYRRSACGPLFLGKSKRLHPGFSLVVSLFFGCFSALAQDFSQNDAKASALLSQMTLNEKIGQMVQVDCLALADKSDVAKYFVGSVLSGGNSDPAAGNSPQA